MAGRPGLVRALVALVVSVPLLVVGVGATTPDGSAHAVPIQIDIGTPGPFGAVTVIGDSVLLGSAEYSPTLPERLAERGWGPIRFRAGEGYHTGRFPTGRPDFSSSTWIARWRAQGWDAPNVIVNLGSNDFLFCGTDQACARDAILHLVDTIGPGREVWWPKISLFFTNRPQQDAWNAALDQVAAERSNVTTWDWPAELASGGYDSYDGTHLDGVGYRRRSLRMAEVFTVDVARATRTGGDAVLPAPTAEPSRYRPVTATRLIDTRVDAPGRQRNGAVLELDLTDHLADALVPDASAVALYVAAARPASDGYLTTGPCDVANDTATVNFAARSAHGAPTISALGEDGTVCITTVGDTDVVVDLQGAFVPGHTGLALAPLDTPDRLADTRQTGRRTELVVDVPGGADAVAVNIAAAGAGENGFLSAYACGSPTGTANVNYRPGPATSASAIVDVSPAGTICVSSSTSTDVIVDITATLRRGDGLEFVPVLPTRTLDTRVGTGGWSPIHGSGQTLDVRVAPAAAQAVTGTLTAVRPLSTTFVAGYGCSGDPPNASVNAGVLRIAANSLTTAVDPAGRLCLYASAATGTVFDTTGWWVAS